MLKRMIGSTFILPTLSKTSEINQFIFDDQVGSTLLARQRHLPDAARRRRRARRLPHHRRHRHLRRPRRDGGYINRPRADGEELIELVELAGEQHLFYPSIPIDVALIRASTADTEGNLFCDDEGLTQGILVQATAARNSGGIVIAQVRRIVEAGSMHPLMVEVPGRRRRLRGRPRGRPAVGLRPQHGRLPGHHRRPPPAASRTSPTSPSPPRRSSPAAPSWRSSPATSSTSAPASPAA